MKKIICLACLIALLTGCASEASTSSSESTLPAGDFNFIAQQTEPVHTTGTAPSSPAEISGQTGSELPSDVDVPIESTEWQGESEEDPISDVPSSENTGTTASYVSPFEDLSTTVSMQIGANVYISVPVSLTEEPIDLSAFVESMRLAHTLVSSADYGDPEVVKNVYSAGTCFNVADNSLYIDGLGVFYWCRSFASSLDEAKSPTISLFNLGKLTDGTTSLEYSYKALGDMIDSTENDLFYRAVYLVNDVEKLGIPELACRAVLVYDKLTGSASTCLLCVDKRYCEDTSADIEFLTSGVRYSSVAPDMLVRIV